MAFDSTSELLFRIGADTGDAEVNVARFRSLLGKDLDDLSAEFGDWSKKVFGDLSSVQGAMTAGAAAVVAGAIAVGAAANAAANHYAAYVEEIARGSKTTGISAEMMSGLKLAADETGTSYDALVTGLTRFSSTIVKAAEGGKRQETMFARLGISQAQVQAGEQDMLPLLMLVTDKFHGMTSQVDKAAMARELFSLGGTGLLNFLSQGSEGLKKFQEKAAEMGRVIGTDDVKAMKEYKASLEAIKTEHEALDVTIGRTTLPIKTHWEEMKTAILKTVFTMATWKELVRHLGNPIAASANLASRLGMEFARIDSETKRLVESMQHINKPGGAGLGGLAAKAAVEEFHGLSDIVRELQTQLADLAGGEAAAAQKESVLLERLEEQRQKLQKLFAEGKISKATLDAEMQESRLASVMIPELAKAAGDKAAQAVRDAGVQLQEAVLRQGEQTLATKEQLLALDIQQRRQKLVEEHRNNAENLAELAVLEKVGYERIARDRAATIEKSNRDIDGLQTAHQERTYANEVAAWNREIDAQQAQGIKEIGFDLGLWLKIEAGRNAGLRRLAEDQERVFQEAIVHLDERLKQTISKETTAKERLRIIYQEDLARFSDVEKKKDLLTAKGPEQAAAIEAKYAALRTAVAQKYAVDLQALKNSQGWRGVFGDEFAQSIRRNEALTREWATSTNQSHMMVRMSLEALKETGQDTFKAFAQAEGQAIANAIVYSQNIGQAMQAAAAATLESLAARAITQSLYCLGLAAMDYAEWNFSGMASALEAAAIFAAIGGGAALAGRAIAPKQAGAGAGPGGASGYAGGAGGSGGGASAGAGGNGGGGGNSGPHVTINIQGHVVGTSGVNQLVGMINDAVVRGGAPLTSTNTLTGRQVVRG